MCNFPLWPQFQKSLVRFRWAPWLSKRARTQPEARQRRRYQSSNWDPPKTELKLKSRISKRPCRISIVLLARIHCMVILQTLWILAVSWYSILISVLAEWLLIKYIAECQFTCVNTVNTFLNIFHHIYASLLENQFPQISFTLNLTCLHYHRKHFKLTLVTQSVTQYIRYPDPPRMQITMKLIKNLIVYSLHLSLLDIFFLASWWRCSANSPCKTS